MLVDSETGYDSAPTARSNAALSLAAQKHCFTYGAEFLPDVIVRAEGMYLWTASGKKVMDWTSGQMSCLLGHGHPEIVKTITESAKSLDHLYSGMLSPPVIDLATTLVGQLPKGLDKAMFLSTGGESNECAIRLAKLYTGKFEMVGLAASWHGSTSGAQGVQYNAGRKNCGPLMPGMHMLPSPDAYRSIFRHPDGSYDWETELNYGWSMIDKSSCGALAAVIMEPVQSSGGMITIPPGYMRAMKIHCEKRGMLLIVDEAQTAMARSGDIFAVNHTDNGGVVPDILTMSKTLGNGLPLSAVVTSNAIAQHTRENGFMFYTTHANDPLPAAVGLKTMQLVLRDDSALLHHARNMGAKLHAGLHDIMSRYACIGYIRGRGLMAGVEIVRDRRQGTQADIEVGKRISAKAMDLGLSAMISAKSYFSGCIRIAPPIIISDEEMEWGLRTFEKAFELTEGSGRI
ncbi:2,2-dialkylglycine decarboxylase (pyruvate) [Capronia coronata CBS 617.96]|uniref:2,2-dialkylglycine decarboxylase (Pyruvate) n=1 Tax=Capronia coronata CBS 617.96 TaxID=1182541 RepID=W9YQU3_9EURO|nr:2,2-dialkylglycine decarboxylase (pyruvate) [Capronia coronata CBS 617.96]EXJ94893.1 2,2-dialkylglycine decarboxylase (pyruvate) [Capronia coronata CBS 617.96]